MPRSPNAHERRDRVPLGRVTAVDALEMELRSELLSGALPDGKRLREVELAERYGVARHTARSAMQLLVSDGLLRYEPHRGFFVPILTLGDAREIYMARIALECEAARVIVMNHCDLAAVDEAYATLCELGSDTPWSEVIAKHLDLHQAVVDTMGNSRISGMFALLRSQVLLCLARMEGPWRHTAVVTEEHGRIVEALHGDRVDRAVDEVRDHLMESLGQLEQSWAQRRGEEVADEG